MEWVITLNGDEIDLRELAKVWDTPELTIDKNESTYTLKGSYFASFTDQEIREKVNELLVPLNAGIILNLGAINPIKIGQIMQIKPDGTRIVLLSGYAIARTRAFACASIIKEDGTQEIHHPADSTVSLLKLAQSDPQVAKICQYINHDFDSFPILYKIYEVIKRDGFPHIQEGKPKGKYCDEGERLRITAHSPSLSGIASRHAYDAMPTEKQSKEKFISLIEAQDFIKKIVREWLETK
jgi:hypothetical protein